MTSEKEPLLVQMDQICKSFGGVMVLDHVDFDLQPGEIHALAGGNGAGKSTLMKILRGVYSKDEGNIHIQGNAVQFNTFDDARRAGVGMVFQEFSLIPTLTVAQNIFLNQEPRRASLVNDRQMVEESRKILDRMGVDLDPQRELGDLRTAHWQLTEIAKALRGQARILVLDEPTASLAKGESERLFDLLRHLRDEGIGIIYISHRMEEVYEIADRITILRNGKKLLTSSLAHITPDQVVEGIVGEVVSMEANRGTERTSGPVVLEAHGLIAQHQVRGVDLTVHAGEVVGVAGLMGSGRTELLEALFGMNKITGGTVEIDGRALEGHSPGQAIAQGIVLIPEDRRLQGLVLTHSVVENLALATLDRVSDGPFLSRQKERTHATRLIDEYRIRVSNPYAEVGLLSGGNQQKVVIAKWLAYGPKLLLMDEPTAGVDIGTKAEIIKQVRQFARDGGAVIVASSEYPELIALSDRFVILKNGQIVQYLKRDQVPDEATLEMWVQGVKKQ